MLLCLCHSSLAYERDTGSKSFLEDLFECEERLPGMSWKPAALRWTDIVSILPGLFKPLSQTESKWVKIDFSRDLVWKRGCYSDMVYCWLRLRWRWNFSPLEKRKLGNFDVRRLSLLHLEQVKVNVFFCFKDWFKGISILVGTVPPHVSRWKDNLGEIPDD